MSALSEHAPKQLNPEQEPTLIAPEQPAIAPEQLALSDLGARYLRAAADRTCATETGNQR